MTMMRMKLNISFSALAIFFGLSRTTCKNIFSTTIINLSRVLRSCILFSSKEDTMKNMPLCFKRFSNVRIVLDCTEVPLAKNKCLKCNINTYSMYYGCHTAKFLLAVSPDGVISFVSLAYGGRTSDKAIVAQSAILEYLEPHIDAVMVDKGFHIEEECEERFLTLIRPDFVRNGRLTAAEARHTRWIAAARVHVERAIQRLKIFSILKKNMPWTLVPFLDSMMVVMLGIVNLSKPVLSNQRFPQHRIQVDPPATDNVVPGPSNVQ